MSGHPGQPQQGFAATKQRLQVAAAGLLAPLWVFLLILRILTPSKQNILYVPPHHSPSRACCFARSKFFLSYGSLRRARTRWQLS